MSVSRRARLGAIAVIAAVAGLVGCALPKGEFSKGSYVHLDAPRYSFQVPDGWREATVEDYPSLGFNRRVFDSMDDAGRKTFLERADLELQAIDTGLISARGAWIQVGSQAGTEGGFGARNPLKAALTEREKQSIWRYFSSARIERAPETDRPTLTLKSIDVVSYGPNRVLRLRFRSDEARGSMHWTVIGLYDRSDSILLAHLGTPDNEDEGLDALEAIATSIRLH